MSKKSRFFVVIAIFLFVIAVMSATAQHAAKGNAKGNDDVNVSASGQKVAVDPASGKIRKPTQEEIQQLVSGMELNDSAEGLTPRIVGTSTLALDLEGRFQNVVIVKINPDGSLSKACVVSKKDAEKFLKADPPKTQKNDPSTWEEK
jgi:hypothetical protein